MYASIFNHPNFPPVLAYTHARHTYDRALRTLPPSLHARTWVRYLLWAESRGGATAVTVFRRYLAVDPTVTEYFCNILLNPKQGEPRPLEAAKLLLSLARKAARGQYTPAEGKSPYQLLGDWIEVVEKYSDEVGLDVEDTDISNAEKAKEKEDAEKLANEPAEEPASSTGKLIRFAGPPIPVKVEGGDTQPYNEEEDPANMKKLNIEYIIQQDGLSVYKDQAGRLWTGLATYWIKRAEFDRAKATFERGMAFVMTMRDFTQIFDAYGEFLESLSSALMEELENEEDDETAQELQDELDGRMKEFEELMDRRPFLANDVTLRRNPNDVQQWEKRVALYGEDDSKVCKTSISLSLSLP